MLKIFTIILSLIVLFTLLPVPVSADFSLVPCGRDINNNEKIDSDEQCQFKHLIILIIRLINYLISMAAIVAIFFILTAGFRLVTALGNPELIKKAKAGISHAVVGFAIVVLSFVIINFVINTVLGNKSAPRNWWNIQCILSTSKDCPI
ncbi:MAG: hypothetical protein Q8P75_02350 [bacterium]|nr:hypothetical protein [bacterium]